MIVLDDVIVDMLSDKKTSKSKLSEVEKLIFFLFLPHNLILLYKNIRLNSRRYFIMNILNMQQLQLAPNCF